SAEQAVPDYTASLNNSIAGLTIGIAKEHFAEGLDSNIAKLVQTAIAELEKLGCKIKEISLPNTHLGVPAYYVVAPAECSSNLARFDGVRYGYRCENPQNLEDLYKRTRGEGFGEEVQRRIMIGTYALSSGYYDAYYLQAQKIRQLISNDYRAAFVDVDCIIGPTTPTPAFKIGEKVADPVSMYLSDIYTIGVNLAGLPGMSIPVGFVDKLPIGMQLIGNYFDEARLLNIAHQYQQVSDWHKQIPDNY
ncbi:MAG: amidase family protein, partial [Pseudomonadota bacterium]|nr:amidase family protein [Pseudomonadota bacterium]